MWRTISKISYNKHSVSDIPKGNKGVGSRSYCLPCRLKGINIKATKIVGIDILWKTSKEPKSYSLVICDVCADDKNVLKHFETLYNIKGSL